MINNSIRWGLAVVAALLAQVALIVLSITCVAVYSYAIHTGESPEFYSAFAKSSGPWVSLIAGGPVFYLIARWIRRRAPSAALGTVMAQVGIYLAIEMAALLLWSEVAVAILPFVIGGMILKFAGAWLGAGATATRALSKTV